MALAFTAGAFFGITSIAVSLEYNEHAQFEKAARIARGIIEQLLEKKGAAPQLYNINMPTISMHQPAEIRIVPMGVQRYGEHYIKRTDPRGRTYYWATNEPPPPPDEIETDLTAVRAGNITVSPLQYDLTKPAELARMADWKLELPEV